MRSPSCLALLRIGLLCAGNGSLKSEVHIWRLLARYSSVHNHPSIYTEGHQCDSISYSKIELAGCERVFLDT